MYEGIVICGECGDELEEYDAFRPKWSGHEPICSKCFREIETLKEKAPEGETPGAKKGVEAKGNMAQSKKEASKILFGLLENLIPNQGRVL